ncbi:hypothetical protein BDD12DRAFT_825692 [Trichophaea hybrida]|nr:hypothetical protein BDD12DRAFT_825692 [Trichophaea hybrida]
MPVMITTSVHLDARNRQIYRIYSVSYTTCITSGPGYPLIQTISSKMFRFKVSHHSCAVLVGYVLVLVGYVLSRAQTFSLHSQARRRENN